MLNKDSSIEDVKKELAAEKKGPAAFAKKEDVDLTDSVGQKVMDGLRTVIPPIYYWEDVENGKSVMMTMAFKILGKNYGMAYPIEDQNAVKIDIQRKKLFAVVKESLDVLLHHGDKILDMFGNIDPALVNDAEAFRWKNDQHWPKKVAAFNKLVRIAPITSSKAIELGLLDKPQLALAT